MFRRFGLWITLVLAFALASIGGSILMQLVNNVWLVPENSPDHELVRRTVMNGTADATIIMQAADRGMLAIFLLCTLAIGMGVAMPIVYFVNKRMELTRRAVPPTFFAVLRQGLWVGLWLSFCVWLQMSRTFGLPVALLIAVVFVLFEVLFHVRQQNVSLSASD